MEDNWKVLPDEPDTSPEIETLPVGAVQPEVSSEMRVLAEEESRDEPQRLKRFLQCCRIRGNIPM